MSATIQHLLDAEPGTAVLVEVDGYMLEIHVEHVADAGLHDGKALTARVEVPSLIDPDDMVFEWTGAACSLDDDDCIACEG